MRLPLNTLEKEILVYLLQGRHRTYADSATREAVYAHFSHMRQIDVLEALLQLEERGMVNMHRDTNTFYYAWLTPKGEVYAGSGV
jgi:hypothetical protein